MVPDPKIFKKRPRRVLSADGKAFLNLWFIPHHTEILSSYRNLDWQVRLALYAIYRASINHALSLSDSVFLWRNSSCSFYNVL